MMRPLDGKVAPITGAGRGIGRDMAPSATRSPLHPREPQDVLSRDRI